MILKKAALLAALAAGSSFSAIILDQIGDPQNLLDAGNSTSNVFTDVLNLGSTQIDDFVLTVPTDLLLVDIAFARSTGTPPPYGSYRVSIWSSVANAAASGDNLTANVVATVLVPAASITITEITPHPTGVGDPTAYIVSIPLNLNIASAGTYWIGVAGVGDSTADDQLYILRSPGAGNSVFVNPLDGYGNGSSLAQDFNTAYRLSGEAALGGVPEPGTIGLIGAGLIGLVAWRRRA